MNEDALQAALSRLRESPDFLLVLSDLKNEFALHLQQLSPEDPSGVKELQFIQQTYELYAGHPITGH